MGRLPKRITTQVTPRLTAKVWAWIGVGLVCVGIYTYYNTSPFQPTLSLQKTDAVLEESIEPVAQQMEEPTTQDLQALPIEQETAEEVIATADLKSDELVQIFDAQEQNPPKTNLKPKAPLVVKRSLGLV